MPSSFILGDGEAWVSMSEGDRLRELEESAAQGWARAAELDAEVRRAWEHAHRLDAALQDYVRLLERTTYNADSLAVWEKSTDFLSDPRFVAAYRAGMDSGHHIEGPKGSATDLHIEWRVHVICWAATHAAKLDGDFVECGVNTGIYSLAACRYINFNKLDKDFWLFDTFAGVPETHMSPEERSTEVEKSAARYSECYDLVRNNFAPYPRAHLVRGTVPETLTSVPIDRVAYLSIDMNIVLPERAAIEYFWPKLVPGGIVVLDDYGWLPHVAQKRALDDFATSVGTEIMVCPTGQGILLKA